MVNQDMESMMTAPGFRFHPTDEELVSYYLKPKICGQGLRFDAIAEVDVYKNEPWDLPVKSKLKTRDLEWYFFSVLDKKYGNGGKTNRATEKGYWKTTGKDRAVSHKSHVIGMKKTLVYHQGRAPHGKRTNWVMHEYKLTDEKLSRAGIFQDAFVLCKIYQKSGPGPKNGEKYGAPLVEEEWENDELVVAAPSNEVVEEADQDIFIDSSDIEQIFGGKIRVEDVLHPLSFYYGDSSGSQFQQTLAQESHSSSGLQRQNQMDLKSPNQELVGESSTNVDDLDFLLDEPFFDAIANDPFDDVAFVESDDLLNTTDVDPSGVDMLGDYLSFFNADEDSSFQYMAFDSSKLGASENLAADQALFTPELGNGGAVPEMTGNHQLLQGYNDGDALVSKQKPENDESGGKYSYVKKASQMLEGISAPPALASEFPSKESALRLASASRSLVHLTAGMVQIQKPRSNGTNISVFVSFGMSHNDPASEVPTKATSAMSRSMTYLVFFWVLILSVTYKIGSCFYSGNVSS